MVKFSLPFTRDEVVAIAEEYPTPIYLYLEQKIRDNARRLNVAMRKAGFADFCNYFAVKALPNPHILRLLVKEDQGADCSSIAELQIAQMVGLSGEKIMFSANNTTATEYQLAQSLGAIINFDDVSHIGYYAEAFGAPKIGCCRYNPGKTTFSDAQEWIIGEPEQAKFGMTKTQIMAAYQQLREMGVKRFGLHTMMLSNDLDWKNHQKIAQQMFSLARELHQELGIALEFINLGGGIGVPYRPEDKAFDLDGFADCLRTAYDEMGLRDLGKPRIIMENGRYITADAGYLISKVINRKQTFKTFIGLDASMHNLMRPAMYGAYHHITVLDPQGDELETVDITGSLCENNDKFAIDRELPKVSVGDYLVLHTVGAHGFSMGFSYNGKLRSAELLMRIDGEVECIRRAETLDDYFATLNGPNVTKLS